MGTVALAHQFERAPPPKTMASQQQLIDIVKRQEEELIALKLQVSEMSKVQREVLAGEETQFKYERFLRNEITDLRAELTQLRSDMIRLQIQVEDHEPATQAAQQPSPETLEKDLEALKEKRFINASQLDI